MLSRLPPTLLVTLLIACSGSQSPEVADPTTAPNQVAGPPAVRVVFRTGKVFAREGKREWLIAEVSRDEMLWAPDGMRFAYLKLQKEDPTSQPTAAVEKPPTDERTDAPAKSSPKQAKADSSPIFHVVIRNVRGDSVNEFPVYRPGRPSELDWIDNNSIGYLAPPDESGDAYVVHTVSTSEILQVYRGTRFIWSPGRKQLAYIAHPKRDQQVKVNQEVVWPRASDATRTKLRGRRGRKSRKNPRRRIKGQLVWSPDGTGLAFMALDGRNKARLVVLLVLDNQEGDLSWPLPSTALLPGNRLFWGDSKVVIGESMLKPRFAASWRRIR